MLSLWYALLTAPSLLSWEKPPLSVIPLAKGVRIKKKKKKKTSIGRWSSLLGQIYTASHYSNYWSRNTTQTIILSGQYYPTHSPKWVIVINLTTYRSGDLIRPLKKEWFLITSL